mmetsp:Transcript_67243/g.60373  ORF Transcript_67243/g.60373 Transcript_67243/m.60373 type:complete len:121 (-) Transcript_67243:228-590(-)
MASWNDDGLGMDDSVNVSDWQNELLGCGSDPGTCCYACMCPLFAAGEIYANADLGHCAVGFLLCLCFSPCHSCCVTSRVRKRFAISGSAIGDIAACLFCPPCQLTRELREVREVRDDRGY